MVKYSCSCLNVTILAEVVEDGIVSEKILASCPLGMNVTRVELIDQGMDVHHKCLLHREKTDSWTVFTCLLCRLRTHTVNYVDQLVLISHDLLNEDESSKLKQKSDYSRAFKLYLGKFCSLSDGPSQPFDKLQEQVSLLQAALKDYLVEEEAIVERKIRRYEEEQRIQFSKLKENAQQEKNKLTSILFNNLEPKSLSQRTEKSGVRGHSGLSQSRSVDVTSRPPPSRHNYRSLREPIPDDLGGMFEMEGLDLEAGDSDNESGFLDDGAGSSERLPFPSQNFAQLSENYGRDNHNYHSINMNDDDDDNKNILLSSSVPISMPVNPRMRTSAKPVLEEDDEGPTDFDNIAANMQALAESIPDNERYIFGDRPRQRVNTLDFNWR